MEGLKDPYDNDGWGDDSEAALRYGGGPSRPASQRAVDSLNRAVEQREQRDPEDASVELRQPEVRNHATVADVVGPAATKKAIEEEQETQRGARRTGSAVRRRTRVDDLLTAEEVKVLAAEIGRDLAIAAKARAAHARRWQGRR